MDQDDLWASDKSKPAVRRGARDTEKAAAEIAWLRAGTDKHNIALLLRTADRTVDECSVLLAKLYGRPDRPNQYQSRMGDLRKGYTLYGEAYVAVDTGEVRPTRTGADAIVWRAVPYRPELVVERERCDCCGRLLPETT